METAQFGSPKPCFLQPYTVRYNCSSPRPNKTRARTPNVAASSARSRKVALGHWDLYSLNSVWRRLMFYWCGIVRRVIVITARLSWHLDPAAGNPAQVHEA